MLHVLTLTVLQETKNQSRRSVTREELMWPQSHVSSLPAPRRTIFIAVACVHVWTCVSVCGREKAREMMWGSERAQQLQPPHMPPPFILLPLVCIIIILHMKALCEFPLLSSWCPSLRPFLSTSPSLFPADSLYSLNSRLSPLPLIHHIGPSCLVFSTALTVWEVELL